MTCTKDIIDALIGDFGLSQADITRLTGIPQSRISRWSNGRVPPGADDALRLSALQTTLSKPTKRRKPSQPNQGEV